MSGKIYRACSPLRSNFIQSTIALRNLTHRIKVVRTRLQLHPPVCATIGIRKIIRSSSGEEERVCQRKETADSRNEACRRAPSLSLFYIKYSCKWLELSKW